MTRRGHYVTLVLLAAACADAGPIAPPGIFFPTYEQDGAVPGGIIEGVLEEQDGCLFVTAHSERWLLLWPDGTTARRASGTIEVLDASGQVIGATGGPIRLGGGEARPIEVGGVEAADAWAQDLTGQQAPERCGHQYWLASGAA